MCHLIKLNLTCTFLSFEACADVFYPHFSRNDRILQSISGNFSLYLLKYLLSLPFILLKSFSLKH